MRRILAQCAAAAMLLMSSTTTVIAQNAPDGAPPPAAVRELDIMLMVTALRCRFGEQDFLADYNQFAARHRGTLQRANNAMLVDLARTHGAKGAVGALDRMSISIANRYGNGHPWLDCAALKQATQDLNADAARFDSQVAFLLGSGPIAGQVALASR